MPNLPAIGIIACALGVAGAAMIVEAPGIEARIATQAEEALDGLGLTAFVDGRDVTLTGLASGEDHRDKALIRLASIDGVDRLTNHTTLVSAPSPYVLSMTRTETGEIYLEGHLPDYALRRQIVAALSEVGEVRDYTILAAGPDEDWGEQARAVAKALGTLSSGRAILVDDGVMVTGIYAEIMSDHAFAVLNQPGWRVAVASDPLEAIDRLHTEASDLRDELRIADTRIAEFAAAVEKLSLANADLQTRFEHARAAEVDLKARLDRLLTEVGGQSAEREATQ